MNDEKLKKGLKRSTVFFIIGIVFVLIILIYVSISPNSKKTIYDEYEVLEDTSAGVTKVYLESKGINKEEFEKYLSVAAILKKDTFDKDILDKDKENYLYMLTTINFLNNVKGEELEIDEVNNISIIEPKKVKDIVKELNGKYIKEKINIPGIYEYKVDELGNEIYNIVRQENFVSYLVEFSEINFNGDLIEAKFKNIFGTNEEITKLMNNEEIELDTYEFKVVLKENLNFDYSKYYINDIELINKEKVKYN